MNESIDIAALIERIEALEAARDEDRARIVQLEQQVPELATGVAQIADDCVKVIRTVNGLKSALEQLTSALEVLTLDYAKFKSETARHVTSLLASAPRKPAPPPHGMN